MSSPTPAPDDVVAATSLFLSGDIVLQNPKETGVIFGLVVILSILLENVFGAFRENRSRYVRALFVQVSEEMMIVGTIGLMFVFVVQSVDDLPQRWVMLFRWTTTVLFFMMVLFVMGIVYVAVATTIIINKMKKFERQIVAQGITLSDNLQLTRLENAFLTFRALYMKQVKFLTEKHNHNSIESQMVRIPFAKYLEARMRNTMSKFTDVTWQCWLSLLFASTANSVRLFMLPGKLQSKDHKDFTEGDRLSNHVTFIVCIGWIPFIFCLVGVVMLMRSNRRYMDSVLSAHKASANTATSTGPTTPRSRTSALSASLMGDSNGLDMSNPGDDKAGDKENRSKVWLPPKQLAGELVGDLCEDPSTYLLRGNRSFTLHVLKIPTIMTEFYMAIFIVGMWGEMSRDLGVSQVGLVPMSLIPFFGIFAMLPLALLVITVLTSLGCRLDEKELKRLILRNESKSNPLDGGDEEEGNDEEDMELQKRSFENKLGRKTNQQGLLNVPGGHGGLDDDRDDLINWGEGDTKYIQQVQALKARVKFLEDLCVQYGIQIGDRMSDNFESGALTAGGGDANLSSVYVALSRLQEETKKVAEQQNQLAAMQRASRLAGGGAGGGGGEGPSPRRGMTTFGSSMQPGGSTSDFATLEAVSAAKQYANSKDKGFSVNSVQRPQAHSGQLNNIHRHLNL